MLTVSRRSFIKGSTASLALLGAGLGTTKYFTSNYAYAEPNNTEEWKPAYCPACHNPICGTQVKVTNGIVMEIKGDPNSVTNEGRICPRGASVIGGLYHPYRVKTPLKRTNPEKGLEVDPGWVEITWEEAFDTVTKNLKKVMDENPRGFVFHFGFGNEDAFRRLVFNAALGGTTTITSSGPLCPDHYGPMAAQGTKVDRVDMEHCKLVLLVGRSLGEEWALAHHNTNDYVAAVQRGMKVICVNPRKTVSAQDGEWVPIIPGTDAAFCWALVHTILHEIGQYDERFLKWRTNSPYLIEDISQVYKGTKVHVEGYLRDEVSNKPLVWDEVLNKAVPFDTSRGDTYALTGSYEVNGKKVKTALQIVKDYVAEFTPEWAEEITTVPAARIREIAKEMVETAQIGATINIEGFEFPFRPVATFLGRGANCNPLNTEMYKALTIINELLGAVDVPGGNLAILTGDFHPLDTDKDGILMPPAYDHFKNQYIGQESFEFPPTSMNLKGFYPMQLGVAQLTWKVINDPQSYHVPFEAKALMLHGGNCIASNSNPEHVIAAMKKFDFVFDVALWLDEPSQFADIIFPEHHAMERAAIYNASFVSNKGTTDKTRGLRAILARKPVVEPVYNTMLGEEIYIELAARLGILGKMNMIANNGFQGVYFKDKPHGIGPEFALKPNERYTYEDIIERKIKTLFGPQSGWHDFAQCAVKGYNVSLKESYNYYWAPENKIRIPVYFEYSGRNLKMLMEGLKEHNIKFPFADIEEVARQYASSPMFFEFENMRPTAEYPFKVFQFKTHFQVIDATGLVSNPWLREIQNEYDPNILKVLVPAEAGQALGLKEDDEIIVESEYGYKTQGKVHLSQMIHPQTIGIGGKWGRQAMHLPASTREGPNYNVLLNSDERDIGFMMGNLNNSVRVKIYKA